MGNFEQFLYMGPWSIWLQMYLILRNLLSEWKKFIAGKSINSNKANNVKDLESIGKAI